MDETGPMSGISRRVLFLAAGTGGVLLGIVAFFAWLVVVSSAAGGSWGTAAAAFAVAVVLTAASVWLLRQGWRRRAQPEPNAPMRTALAQLPPGVKPRRTRAARPGIATIAGWAVFAIGLVAALLVEAAHESELDVWRGIRDASSVAVAIVILTSATAGVLLAVARDSRGRQAKLWQVVPIPLALGLFVAFGDQGSGSSGLGIGVGALVFAATGIPLSVGFVLARLYAATRGTTLQLQPAASPATQELEDATDHGRTEALIRDYPTDEDGWSLLAEDQALLATQGYELSATEETTTWSGNDNIIRALFVRSSVASHSPPEGEAEHA